MNVKLYRKFLIAVAAAIAVATPLVADGKISLGDGLAIAGAALGAVGVRQVPNKQP